MPFLYASGLATIFSQFFGGWYEADPRRLMFRKREAVIGSGRLNHPPFFRKARDCSGCR